MNRIHGHASPISSIIAAFCVLALLPSGVATATALDDYVAAADASYTYGPVMETFSGTGYTATMWYMASQTWRTIDEVDRPLWEHQLIIVVPTTLSHTTALLYIDGGTNQGSPPTSPNGELVALALQTQSITAQLRIVPNQRLRFADESDPRYVSSGRTEDELLAYTWDKFKTTGDPTWIAQLPMTKAAVRAMDTVQAEHPSIDGFVVTGASKRGWTTWLTAAVDPRVVAVIPMVIDLLNIEHSMQHHHDAYGFWAEAIRDYEDMQIFTWLHEPEFDALLDIVDPYRYRERLTMPKYLIDSSGDQFFLPDSSQFYYDALQGQKHLRYVPNTGHSLNATALQDLGAYYYAILNGMSLPEYSWTRQADGSIRVESATAPSRVLLWQATNTQTRDFRLNTIGAAWTSSTLTDQGGGVYVGQVSTPSQGWTGYFVELEYDSGTAYPYHFTTSIYVTPDTLPFRNPGGWGTIETAGDGADQITLVHVGGTRYQMGYWYGRLLADQIASCWHTFSSFISADFSFTEEAFDTAIHRMWKSAYFDVVAWEDELRGAADGCVDAGHPEVTFRDFQKMLVLPDMSETGCGLYALWGAATADGSLYQLRNLDWIMGSGIEDYPVVAVYHPVDGRVHATVGFAAPLGAATGGINQDGLAVSEIMGYFCDDEGLDGIPFPVLLRDVLYHDTTLSAALARMHSATRTNQYHYCIADPKAPDPKGRLLFTSAPRFDAYGDETVVEHPCPGLDPYHARLEDVIYWKGHAGGGNMNLYNAISARYGTIDAAKAIEIAQADGVSSTLVSIVYHNTAKEFWVAYANGMDPAQNQQYVHFTLGEPPVSELVRISCSGWTVAGNPVTLSAVVSGLTGDVTYQWEKDGFTLPGHSASTLHFANVTESDAGIYRVLVSDDSGKAVYASPNFHLEVLPAGSLPTTGATGLSVLAVLLAIAELIRRAGKRPRTGHPL